MRTNATIESLREELKASWHYGDEHSSEIFIMRKKIFLMNKETIKDGKLDTTKVLPFE